MPRPAFLPRIPRVPTPAGLTAAALALALQRLNRGRPKSKREDSEEGGVPVEPNRPNSLTGGAAAALEFDEE
ncbi:MAG: hypothetical protein QOJ94_2585 [Sphingomonadales bacterium]|nr:hypothetical protein [Sphingomonadales bacterium]